MKFTELEKMPEGTNFELEAVVLSVEEKTKSSKFWSIELSLDKRISFNIFNSGIALMLKLCVGKVAELKGVTKFYKDNLQLDVMYATMSPTKPIELMPNYNISDRDIDSFLEIIDRLRYPYGKLVHYCLGLDQGKNKDMWNKFKTSCAGLKHHGSKIGGLLLHTLMVCRNLFQIFEGYKNIDTKDYINLQNSTDFNFDRLITKAVLHDIMKIADYTWDRGFFEWSKTELISHVYKSASYVERCNEELGNIVDRAEMQNILYSILSHYGEYSEPKPKSMEDWLLHLADMVDAKIVSSLEV